MSCRALSRNDAIKLAALSTRARTCVNADISSFLNLSLADSPGPDEIRYRLGTQERLESIQDIRRLSVADSTNNDAASNATVRISGNGPPGHIPTSHKLEVINS